MKLDNFFLEQNLKNYWMMSLKSLQETMVYNYDSTNNVKKALKKPSVF